MKTTPFVLLASIVISSVATACRSSSATTTPADSPAATSEPTPVATVSSENADMLDRIDRFLADPRAVDPAPIVNFMINSPDVRVVIGSNLDGVATGSDIPEDAGALLLAAFVAGNVKEQLTRGEKRDAPKAGLVALVQVYEILARDTGLELPGTAALAQAHAEGSLDAWLESHPPGA